MLLMLLHTFSCKHLCAFVQEKIEAFVKSTHGILLSMLGNSTHKLLDDVLTFNVYLRSCLFCLGKVVNCNGFFFQLSTSSAIILTSKLFLLLDQIKLVNISTIEQLKLESVFNLTWAPKITASLCQMPLK